jgi:hypothetical protein
MTPDKQCPDEIRMRVRALNHTPLGCINAARKILRIGIEAARAGSPAEFGKLLVDETKKWAKVIELAGIRPE